MKCRILFSGFALMLSLSCAVSVDYLPQNVHADPGHLKYIEPAHVKPIKYVHAPPILKQYAVAAPVSPPVPNSHVKYIHPDPSAHHPIKYIDDHQHLHYPKHHGDYYDDEPAHYEYGYDVQDHHTGDFKSHTEKRDGHNVQGRYEVLDPDGFKRIVEYTADEHNGFNAVVRREPIDEKIAKKFYEPEIVKHHLAPAAAPIAAPAPLKYYSTHQHAPEAIIAPAPVQKIYDPRVLHHQKVKAHIIAPPPPQYYAPPENPKFFKTVDKIHKYGVNAPAHTGVKYLSPSPSHYNQF